MEIRIKRNSVDVSGYVNAVERDSKTLWSAFGKFVERIAAGAFKRSLERSDDVQLLLNHDPDKVLGGTKDGTLTLTEDNIGLRARATITDPDVVKKARNGELVGWSFGFYDTDDGVDETDVDGIRHRYVKDMDLREVSILDKSKAPAYVGTLIEARSQYPHFRSESEEVEVMDERQPIDYTQYEQIIAEMKGDN